MADLPISSANVDVSTLQKVQTNPSQGLNLAAPNSTSKSPEQTIIASQILSKTAHELVLSLPNQPALRIDISKNSVLAQQLNIGDKVNITIAQDKSSAVITITQQAAKPTAELTVPLSKPLSDSLKNETSLPAKDNLIRSHIEKNGALLLGQARRLPQEQITLKVTDAITIKEKLPGVNALPLNTTMQTSLVLGTDKQLLVEFTKRATPMPSIQLVIPLDKLASTNKLVSLQALPIAKIAHISEVLTPATVLNLKSIKNDMIDMSKPLNQLWLRHQPAAKIIGILSNSLQEASTLSREQIKAELSLQKAPQPQITVPNATPKTSADNLAADPLTPKVKGGITPSVEAKTAILENSANAKMPIIDKHNPIPLPLKELGQVLSKQQLNDLIKAQPKALSAEKEATQNKALSNGQTTETSSAKQPVTSSPLNASDSKPITPSTSAASAIKNDANNDKTAALLGSKAQDFSAVIKESVAVQSTGPATAKIVEKPLAPIQNNKKSQLENDQSLKKNPVQEAVKHLLKNSQTLPSSDSTFKTAFNVSKTIAAQITTPQTINSHIIASSKADTLPVSSAGPINTVTSDVVASQSIKLNPLASSSLLSAIADPKAIDSKTLPQSQKTVPQKTGPQKTGPQNTELPDKVVSGPIPADKSPSISLQKLNALIGALHTSTGETKNANQHTSSGVPSAVSPTLTNAVSNTAATTAPMLSSEPAETSNDELVAIEQLKSLSQRLNKQLPAMSQLTNPAQLSQLVEQFTRFEPLSSASINLSSLGPLASALQLILGGRHAAQNQAMSPQLIKHLNQLMKKTRGGSASNLTSALQMLGNLKSFKPLEEALTNISSNIQFYQYQNAEQQQNNQSLFYFNLPTKEPHVPQVEGEVEQQASNDKKGEKTWRLTLLLPCGDTDKIKVNAILSGNGVELDLTCNNQSLLERANFYKNFLASRLESLGFETPKVSCQQGDIPATLLKRPNQLVELMV